MMPSRRAEADQSPPVGETLDRVSRFAEKVSIALPARVAASGAVPGMAYTVAVAPVLANAGNRKDESALSVRMVLMGTPEMVKSTKVPASIAGTCQMSRTIIMVPGFSLPICEKLSSHDTEVLVVATACSLIRVNRMTLLGNFTSSAAMVLGVRYTGLALRSSRMFSGYRESGVSRMTTSDSREASK